MNKTPPRRGRFLAAFSILIASGLVLAAVPTRAQMVYHAAPDLRQVVGPIWSNTRTDTAPDGRKFQGRFGNETVRLSLDRLPEHTEARIIFDVHAIGNWRGNEGKGMFKVTVPGTLPLLQTNFSNTDALQAYPEAAPYSDYPARKDALATNSLGYPAPGDSTYRISRVFPHTDNRLEVEFAASGLPKDATWGLSNVRVVLYSTVPGNVVSNGDFEVPVVSSAADKPEEVIGWRVPAGTAALRNNRDAGPGTLPGNPPAASGEQFLELNGTLEQDVPTAPNRQYRLRFRLADTKALSSVQVTWDGREVAKIRVTFNPNSLGGVDWQPFEYLVTGPELGEKSRLSFRVVDGGAPVRLDAVSVSPVEAGDVDVSGATDMQDAAEVGRLFFGLSEGDPYKRIRADVFPFAGAGGRQHGDGWLTVQDALVALRLADGRMGYLPMAEAAVDDLYKHFWIGSPTDGFIMPAWGGRPDRNHPHGSVWEHAQMLRTMMDLYRVNHDPGLLTRIKLHWKWMVNNLAEELTIVGGGTNMNWSDDAGWSTIMYLDVYRLTQDPEALDMAKTLFNNVYERWVDDTYGGGQWYTDEHNQKAVYQVSQILTGLRIYDITGDASFRDRSLGLYNWVDKALARGRGLYYVDYDRNGPVKKNGPPEPASSDTMLAGNMAMAVTAARIYRATGDRKYLDKAVQTANAILAIETDGGVYMNDRDANVEGFYIADWVAEVLSLPGIGPEHAETLRRTADSIYANARTQDGMYSGNWSGPAQGPLVAWGKPGHGFRPDQIMISSNSVHMIVGAASLGALKPEPARPF